jgi:PEGA domain
MFVIARLFPFLPRRGRQPLGCVVVHAGDEWAGGLKRVRTVLLVAGGVGVAGIAGWLLAGGSLAPAEMLRSQLTSGTDQTSSGTAPVHLDSTPSRAQVSIDGARAGWTPLDVRLSPGQHVLGLQHPDALDHEQMLAIPESGATVSVELWRRRPDVVPLRPVYPGASLADARFLDDGQVALRVSLPAQSGSEPPASCGGWTRPPGSPHGWRFRAATRPLPPWPWSPVASGSPTWCQARPPA